MCQKLSGDIPPDIVPVMSSCKNRNVLSGRRGFKSFPHPNSEIRCRNKSSDTLQHAGHWPRQGQNPRLLAPSPGRSLTTATVPCSLPAAYFHFPVAWLWWSSFHMAPTCNPSSPGELHRNTPPPKCFTDVFKCLSFNHKEKQMKNTKFTRSHPKAPGTPWKEHEKP